MFIISSPSSKKDSLSKADGHVDFLHNLTQIIGAIIIFLLPSNKIQCGSLF